MSNFQYKFVVIYIVYGVHIQTSVLILRDPKGSHPGRACGVCCITWYEEHHVLYLKTVGSRYMVLLCWYDLEAIE